MAMGKFSGLGGAEESGAPHASADPQDKIVSIFCCILCVVYSPQLQVALTMAEASKLFDKMNGTGGGAGNQAAKVDGMFIHPLHCLTHVTDYTICIQFSHTLRCCYGNVPLWAIQNDGRSEPAARRGKRMEFRVGCL